MGNELPKIQSAMKQKIHQKLHFAEVENLSYNEEDLSVTKASAVFIHDRLASCQLKYTLPDLLRIFHYKKQMLNKENPALADVFYHEPISQARYLQDQLVQDPASFSHKYPLAGYIISLKDVILYKNSDCTHGFVINLNRPVKNSGKFVSILESKGALVTAKGNVPQGVFSMETENNIFGIVTNPHNKTRIAGGSTGGDAVLVASGAVNVCIGTDQGGSLRIPALFCGIASFKPTEGRFADESSTGSFDFGDHYGKTGDIFALIPETIGPMANWVDDLIPIMKIMAEHNAEYFDFPCTEWKQVQLPKRVGIIRGFDDIMELCLTAQRALTESAAHIRSLGCEVVEIDLNDIVQDILVTTLAIFFKNKQLKKVIKGVINIQEPLVSAFHEIRTLMKVPVSIIRQLRKTSVVSQREKYFLDAFILAKDFNYSYLKRKRQELIYQVISRFKALDIEAALAPGLFPAVKVRTSKDNNLMCLFVFIWNFLNFPAGALPITRVQENEQTYESKFKDKITKSLQENMKETSGLPVGIQVVGLPYKDEQVLEVMRQLEKQVNYSQSFILK